MEEKAFTLINRGMNRDLSISKVGESTVYENRNIRILARNNNTLLSVTNERGTKDAEISFSDSGSVVGWNVLKDNIIIFFHSAPAQDLIYRVHYNGAGFEKSLLFAGDLDLHDEYPIESIVDFESDDVQKIYWVDGWNVLRFMNFVAKQRDVVKDNITYHYYPWQDDDGNYDNTYFDSNRAAKFDVDVTIRKDAAGESRLNGIAQYLITYYNEHGQETNYVWISDLVYLSPVGRGGEADGTNNNRVILTIKNLDTSFDHFRVYSILRSSLDGTVVSYLISDMKTSNPEDGITVIDDGAHMTLQDTDRLLYLGSAPAIAGTLEQKDQTLFLGDLHSIGRGNLIEELSSITDALYNEEDGKSNCITFELTNASGDGSEIADIPYVSDESIYPYNNQLELTSSRILSFKGGEKYRFALKFQLSDGAETDAFWIGDAENELYPVIDNERIHRVVARCSLSGADVIKLQNLGVKTVQLMIAEATYADRSVKAQGFINPTVFNVWERYNKRVFSYPSWVTRIRGSEVENLHFKPIHNSVSDTGEIQCNYWPNDAIEPTPYYRFKNYTGPAGVHEYYTDYTLYGQTTYSHYMIVCELTLSKSFNVLMSANVNIYEGKNLSSENVISTLPFTDDTVYIGQTTDTYQIRYSRTGWISVVSSYGDAWGSGIDELYSKINDFISDQVGIADPTVRVSRASLGRWFGDDFLNHGGFGAVNGGVFNVFYGEDTMFDSVLAAANAGQAGEGTLPSTSRWYNNTSSYTQSDDYSYTPALYTKHLMFVDENIVTLNSPEISYEAVSLDNGQYDFRVIGVAKVTSVIGDYEIDADKGNLSGENVFSRSFKGMSRLGGLVSWPLWVDNGLSAKPDASKDIRKRTSADYSGYNQSIVYYWLHMWGRTGTITGFEDEDSSMKGNLHSKIFANAHISYNTIYSNAVNYSGITMRISDENDNRFISFGDAKTYVGNPNIMLSCPGDMRYPIRYSTITPSADEIPDDNTAFLYSDQIIQIKYNSGRHALIPLGVDKNEKDNLLPYVFESDKFENHFNFPDEALSLNLSPAYLPWDNAKDTYDYLQIDRNASWEYTVLRGTLDKDEMTYSGSYYSRTGLDAAPMEVKAAIAAKDSDVFKNRRFYMYLRHVEYPYGDDEPVYYFVLVDFSAIKIKHMSGDAIYADFENAKVLHYHEQGASYDEHDYFIMNTGIYVTTDVETPIVRARGLRYLDATAMTDIPYELNEYKYSQLEFNVDGLNEGDNYVLIGEIYQSYEDGEDKRYGGITKSDVANNRFVVAGPQYPIENLSRDSDNYLLYANQGDTYFQRWDCIKTKPYSKDSANGVIDIMSLMLETHINLDGRTDTQRGTDYLASIDTSNFGSINRVYTQKNNFKVSRDLDDELNTDSYRSSITWTLPKSDLSDIDEWTHITLASSLKLDGDKGIVRAIRRFRNSLIAFQDKSIAEVLFNSRTQISTEDGVPVEIGNSGKVDGKRYITNRYGCLNKWSIVEGQNALYFVDNLNKAFCSFSGDVDNISARLGFTNWFKNNNSIEPWTPKNFNNIISFYDRVQSDVYLVGSSELEQPCLVYNELLGAFTSFFDYGSVDMMVNIDDKFVSLKNNHLWYQNEGLYCNFFGEQYPFYVQYRCTPNPLTDKIWTNIEYRADFVRILDANGDNMFENEYNVDDSSDDVYQPDETFDSLRVFNEYQTTTNFIKKAVKKFRTWRYAIPRAVPNSDGKHNKFGLDRIRNPWVSVKLEKTQVGDERRDMVQIHDVTIKYFE